MYNFETYDPTKPRMVTSFKGNQKLIFQGFRYNIHHVVPTKGLKTWRCVCAKKLTSARSWCKGRAETWDNDTKGTAKGEHNHQEEHEIAEQEYFKSQLILAAIANPNATLNDLIEEASAFMTEGVQFGSRDSLKKSLMQARKSAENGVFKLKNYKNSDPSRNNNNNSTTSNKNGHQSLSIPQNVLTQHHAPNQQVQQQTQQQNNSVKIPEKLKDLMDLKMFEQNGPMLSLFSIAHQQQQQQQRQFQQPQQLNLVETNNNIGKVTNNNNKNTSNATAAAAAAAAALIFNNNNANGGNISTSNESDNPNESILFSSSSASSLLSQFVNNSTNFVNASYSHGDSINTSPGPNAHANAGAAFGDFLFNSGLEITMDGSTPKLTRLDASRLRSIGANSPAQCTSSNATFNDSGIGTTPLNGPYHGQGRRRKNVSATNFDASLQSSSDGFQSPIGSNTPFGNITSANNNGQQNLIQQQQKKKMARINNIFDKLSHKAAAAASSSSSNQFVIPCGQSSANGNASNSSQRNSPFSTASSTGAFDDGISRSSALFSGSNIPTIGFAAAAPPKHSTTIETQTDESFLSDIYKKNMASFNDSAVRLNACIGRAINNSHCECRVITVCCCSEETCKRRKIAVISTDTTPPSTPSNSFATESVPSPKHQSEQSSKELDYDIQSADIETHDNDCVDDAEVDVVGAPGTPSSAIAINSDNDCEMVSEQIRQPIFENEKDDSDDTASIELNVKNKITD